MYSVKQLTYLCVIVIVALIGVIVYGHVTACEGVATYVKCRDFWQ